LTAKKDSCFRYYSNVSGKASIKNSSLPIDHNQDI